MKQAFEHRVRRLRSRRQTGFTLVELAIVLAVIGLIIGAVAIGKDVQRNAEYTKIKNKFVEQWEQAYMEYYQRTGVVIGDNQTAPQNMVNGEGFTGRSGRNMTTAATVPPGAICDKAMAPGLTARAGDRTDLRVLMTRVGIRMPPGRAEGLEDRYVYLDTNGNPQEVQVCFRWNIPLASGAAANAVGEGSGNVMVITGLTPDLARSLDQMIDGKPDEREGRFRRQGVENNAGGAINQPGQEWSQSNRDLIGTSNDASLDEDQVAIVTAIYKMNQ